MDSVHGGALADGILNFPWESSAGFNGLRPKWNARNPTQRRGNLVEFLKIEPFVQHSGRCLFHSASSICGRLERDIRGGSASDLKEERARAKVPGPSPSKRLNFGRWRTRLAEGPACLLPCVR